MPDNRYDVAIVGGGCSSTLVAANLLRNAKASISILLTERSRQR